MIEPATWIEANQRYLSAALAGVRARLEQRAGHMPEPADLDGAWDERTAPGLPSDARAVPALATLCETFALSAFERQVLLLCAGVELDSRFPGLCAAAQDDATRTYPTFSLALAALDEPHWSALAPSGPLRRWRLVEIGSAPSPPLTLAPLRIDERILHYLAGVQFLDERLADLLALIAPEYDLVPSHQALAQRIRSAWEHSAGRPQLVQLCGVSDTSKRTIAASACSDVGLHLFAIPADAIPAHAGEREGLLRLWAREAALMSGALYLDAEAVDMADKGAVALTTRFMERVPGPVLVGTERHWPALSRPVLTLDVGKPTAKEQQTLWQGLLGEVAAGLNGHIVRLTSEFNLSAATIHAATRVALDEGADGEDLATRLWEANLAQVRPRLEDLAQRIEPAAGWDDLVLPEQAARTLREIDAHVRQRATVYDNWGFGTKGARGLGISALFSGASGTGKTMAAEVLAGELRLDLYRIDLSQIVSKYIGETEKNLRRVFDAAEDGGAILFFDEADALFGKRSEVKDSHDRYANIEINYLLQRMESYRGLAVLATNMKSALDPAFMRRIRFMVSFPFPDAAQRAEIWRRIFPPAMPANGLDIARLAQLNIAGGSIRNIALNAAFLAAASGDVVRMSHLLQAAKSEYAKLEKPLNAAEIGGWP
jgi:AAA+ superfamily predicted ATPase